MNPSHPTRWWHTLADGRVQCDLCPRRCRLAEGQSGLCFVRKAERGQVVLTTYGQSTGFWTEPIEKKPLWHFLPGTGALSFGTDGCNLRCKFCPAWEIDRSQVTTEAGAPTAIALAAKQLGCASVAFTYNEPTVFHEYALDTARACHALGLKTVVVTNGYANAEPRREFYAEMDAVCVDLKGFRDVFYRSVCSGHLEPVLDTLRFIRRGTPVWLEVVNMVLPSLNDASAAVADMCRWMVDELGPEVPLHFTTFWPASRMKDRPRTSVDRLRRARETALRNGLQNVYTSEGDDDVGQTTWCHGCNEPVIIRDGWLVTGWHLDAGGACTACGTRCAGVFAPQGAGPWDGATGVVHLADATHGTELVCAMTHPITMFG